MSEQQITPEGLSMIFPLLQLKTQGSQLTSSRTAVLWAQRSSASDPERNYIYLTISAPDVPAKSLKVDLKSQSLTFTGHSETKKTTYHVHLEFYGEIDVEVRLTPTCSSIQSYGLLFLVRTSQYRALLEGQELPEANSIRQTCMLIIRPLTLLPTELQNQS